MWLIMNSSYNIYSGPLTSHCKTNNFYEHLRQCNFDDRLKQCTKQSLPLTQWKPYQIIDRLHNCDETSTESKIKSIIYLFII